MALLPSQLQPESMVDYPPKRDGPYTRQKQRMRGGDDDEYRAGSLLDLDEAECAKAARKLVEQQDESAAWQRKREQWKVNRWRRMGVPNVALVKAQDEKRWVAWAPKNVRFDASSAMKKAATLCRRMVALIFADPPRPEAVPASGDDDDVQAAEFAGRVLEDIQGESGLNDTAAARKAVDLGCTYDSGFVLYSVDPRGAGLKGVEIQAGPEALTVDDALEHDEMDPMTGMPTGRRIPWPETVNRYVTDDDRLTDVEAEARFEWMPGLRLEVLSQRNVRFLPHTAEDVWDAHGVAIPCFKTWSEVKQLFPDLANLPPDIIDEVLKYRPTDADELMDPLERRDLGARGENRDERLCYVQTTVYRACNDYPDGCYVVTVGDMLAPYRDVWTHTVDGKRLVMDLPLTQYKQFEEDGRTVGMMEIVGPGDTLRTQIVSFLLDHFDRFQNRKILLPTTSILQPEDMLLPMKTVLHMNPGGEPVFEPIPDIPKDAYSLLSLVSTEMDNTSGLQQAAQGVEDPSVGSGRHAQVIVSQVYAGLSDIIQNCERAYIRGCRIQLQLIRAYFTTPRQIKWVGEDGKYKQQSWTGSDLGSTADVRMARGSFSQMTKMQKIALAQQYRAEGVLDPEAYRESIEGSLGGVLGLQDDPVRMRIRRELSEWDDGPPEGYAPPQPMIDPMTMQPVMPPDPYALATFPPTPSDALPGIAQIRLTEIARFMQSSRYLTKPPPWRALVDNEFVRMQQVVAPPPPALPPSAPPAAPLPMPVMPPPEAMAPTAVVPPPLAPPPMVMPPPPVNVTVEQPKDRPTRKSVRLVKGPDGETLGAEVTETPDAAVKTMSFVRGPDGQIMGAEVDDTGMMDMPL